MNTRILISTLALLACAVSPSRARTDIEVSFNYFHDQLTPYGEWVQAADYGPAWHPLQVDPDWAPYVDGRWVHTDDGWTWVSDEPWADMVYHYGRWVYLDDYGWSWVPGYEWAPAWVSWRSSDDYVGWAPLPPEARWRPSVGFSVWVDSYYDIGPRYYHFCHARDFGEPNLRRHIRPWRENTTIITNTVNITNINYLADSGRIYTGGPQLGFLQARSAKPLRSYRVVEDPRFNRSMIRGDEFVAVRPRIAARPEAGLAAIAGSITRRLPGDKVDHGWKNVGPEADRHALRDRMRSQVNGLTPESAPARVVPRASGGLSTKQLQALGNRVADEPPSKGKPKDKMKPTPNGAVARPERVPVETGADGKGKMNPGPKPKDRSGDTPPKPVHRNEDNKASTKTPPMERHVQEGPPQKPKEQRSVPMVKKLDAQPKKQNPPPKPKSQETPKKMEKPKAPAAKPEPHAPSPKGKPSDGGGKGKDHKKDDKKDR